MQVRWIENITFELQSEMKRVVTAVFPTLQGTKYAESKGFKVHGNQVVQRTPAS